MQSRFKRLVGSTRRSSNNSLTSTTANSSSTNLAAPTSTPSAASANGQQRTPSSSAAASTTSNSSALSTSSASTAQQASASSTSLAQMNPNNPSQPLGRPPSYQYANQGNGNLGAPGHPNAGRPSSPMPPPPINTGGGHAYAPAHNQNMYNQPAPPGYPMNNQPSGYGYGAPAPQGPHSYNRLAEVEGSARSKAQLIVGIDFVGSSSRRRCEA